VRKEKRYLISTEDERTWKFDRPVIFLGEWCRLYSQKNIWQFMDAIVAEPYGLTQEKKDIDYKEARRIEDELLADLISILNQYHNVNFSKRFWKILLGHWVYRFVDLILNRVNTLKKCIKKYPFSGITVFDDKDYSLVTDDSLSSIWAVNDSVWNSVLTKKILDYMENKNFSTEIISNKKYTKFQLPSKSTNFKNSKKIKDIFKKGINSISIFLSKNDDALILKTYLSKIDEIKLKLLMGQFPSLSSTFELKIDSKLDIELRKKLGKKLSDKFFKNSKDSIEHYASQLLFEMLPICYLEGFAKLNDFSSRQAWPKNPKFIFTSNSFDTDEIFKIYTASKVEAGSAYFVGQHGNYGVTKNHINPSIEEITSNKFLTWGWKDSLVQHEKAFMFKINARKLWKYNSNGCLLLIEVCLNHRLSTFDNTFEYINYLDEQKKLVSNLSEAARNALLIRLQSAQRNFKWSEDLRWKDFDSGIKLNYGDTPITKLIKNSRLVIHSYDSTGILETLASNIPTLAFWRGEYDHLRPSAIPYYKLLVNAGIVHFTPDSIADKVNEIWDDIESWWMQDTIQIARRKFCENYAQTSENPSEDLKKILLDSLE